MRHLRCWKALACRFLHGGADLESGRCRRQGFAETDGNGIGDAARHLPEEAAAFEAEDAAPHAVEVDGDDRHIDAFDDALESAAEGKHLAGARDLAFGKDADDFVVAKGVACRAQRADHLARTLLAGDRNGLQHSRERLDHAVLVDALVHEEADGPIGGGDQQRGIDERHVVADEKRAGSSPGSCRGR